MRIFHIVSLVGTVTLLHTWYTVSLPIIRGRRQSRVTLNNFQPSGNSWSTWVAAHPGYTVHPQGTGPHAFHGYYFRILTRQGDAASGGPINYVKNGQMTGGFALIVYPVEWNKSGIMTFIVNQDGKVYQRDFGEDTPTGTVTLSEYNPDENWTLVETPGISDQIHPK